MTIWHRPDAQHTPVCLVVMDGWGIAPPGPGNAIAQARTPTFDRLVSTHDVAQLDASGEAVGLPAGQMGNSEVGHLTLGAGSVVPQTLTVIDRQIARGPLTANPVLRRALTRSPRVHLLGMVSDGGVHSALSHVIALVEAAAQLDVEDLVLHCFTDGRDTPPDSAAAYLTQLQETCRRVGHGRVASVMGRFWAMDRDNRWQRTQAAYDLLVHGRADHHAADPIQAVTDAYTRGETDEFIAPTTVDGEGRIDACDSVVCFNFRADRMRQLVRALAEPALGRDPDALPGWRGRRSGQPVAQLTTMTAYERDWRYPVAFEAARPPITLGAVLEAADWPQLHVAETEKYAHVTYFFNGGRETPYRGERRVLVPSRRDVTTYDLAPRMRAREITEALIEALNEDRPRFAIVNLANADMVGHTGVLAATIAAVEVVDRSLAQITAAVAANGGTTVITADHGNAERMLENDGGPSTTHSSNPVPLIIAAPDVRPQPCGTLADVAPTILELLDLKLPEQMSGRSLLAADRRRGVLSRGALRMPGARDPW